MNIDGIKRDRNIIAEIQAYHVTDDIRWMEKSIGYKRCKGAYVFKILDEISCKPTFGSDLTVVKTQPLSG